MKRFTGSPRRLLSPTEKDAIKAEIREREMQLHSPDLVDMRGTQGVWAPNPKESAAHSGIASQQLAKLKRTLEEGTVSDFSKSSIRKRETEIKILEERISSRLAPRDVYFAKRSDTKDYNKTVDHLVKVELSPEHQAEVLKLQNLYKARSAGESNQANSRENPECGSIEHLRK